MKTDTHINISLILLNLATLSMLVFMLWDRFPRRIGKAATVIETNVVLECRWGFGLPPKVADVGIDDSKRDAVVNGWSQWWTFIQNPAPKEDASILYGEWLSLHTNAEMLVFHRNGRLDYHFRDNHVWYLTYGFWSDKQTIPPSLFAGSWGPGPLSPPNPEDIMLLQSVVISSNSQNNIGWIMTARDLSGVEIHFKKIKE